MNFLRQANTAIKSAKELEKNLASVGITKDKFLGKKDGAAAGPTGAPTDGSGAPVNASGQPSNAYPTNTTANTYNPPVNSYQPPHGAPPNGYAPQGVPVNTYAPPVDNNYSAPSSGSTNVYSQPTGVYSPPTSPDVSEVPPQSKLNYPILTGNERTNNIVRQSYEARKPEFEALLAGLKEQAWSAALDSAAKNTHADHQAAKTASPESV